MLGLVLLVHATVACSDATEPRVPTTLQVEPVALELEWGRAKTAEISVRLLDQNGQVFSELPAGFGLTWESADERIAIVRNGVVTGRHTGETTVTARAGTLSPAQVQVQVGPAPMMLDGDLSFGFEGTHNGTFAASGPWPFDPADPRVLYTEWFAALLPEFAITSIDIYGDQLIEARQRRADGLWDRFYLSVRGPATEPGTVDIRGAALHLGAASGSEWLGGFEVMYWNDRSPGGTITFTAVSPERLVGTFALELLNRGDGASLLGSITTVNGSFDIPVVMAQPWPEPEVQL
jgi:hypothetical protein